MTAVIVEVALEPATVPAVRRLVWSCSPASLQRRFFLPAAFPPEKVWARSRRYLLAGPPDGAAVVAMADDVPVGLANFIVIGAKRMEVSLLVADAWQRRGVGSRLLAEELARPRWAGWTVVATVQPDNWPVRSLMKRFGPWRLVDRDPSAWEYAVTLPGQA